MDNRKEKYALTRALIAIENLKQQMDNFLQVDEEVTSSSDYKPKHKKKVVANEESNY